MWYRHWFLTVEPWVQCQVNSGAIDSGQSGTVVQVSFLNLFFFFLLTTIPSCLHSYLSMTDGQVKTWHDPTQLWFYTKFEQLMCHARVQKLNYLHAVHHTMPTQAKHSRVLLQKLMVSQVVNKFPVFYGTHGFILSNRTCILVLIIARWIWPTRSHPLSLVSTLKLSSDQCLGIPSGFFPSCFFVTTPYAL